MRFLFDVILLLYENKANNRKANNKQECILRKSVLFMNIKKIPKKHCAFLLLIATEMHLHIRVRDQRKEIFEVNYKRDANYAKQETVSTNVNRFSQKESF